MQDNYYILLGLHPDENDWTAIEKQICKCKVEWSNIALGGVGQKKREAGRKLDLIRKIRADLKDDAKREKIRSEARKLLAAQQKKKFDVIDAYIIKWAEGREVNQEFFQEVIKQAGRTIGGTVSASDVESRLKQQGIRVARPERVQNARRSETLGVIEAKNIQSCLESLGKKHLYDFLGRKRSVPSAALRSRANDVYGAAHGTGRADAETTARKRLTGYCNKVFKNEESRKRYDNTLDKQVLGQLDAHLDLAGVDEHLASTEVKKVMEVAVELGIDQGIARQYIDDYAKKKKWGIQRTTASEDRKLQETLTRWEAEMSVPTNLRVSIAGGTARLHWQNARWHPSLAYVVVRRESGAPRDSKDGTAVGRDVNADFFDDARVPPGTPWHYSVFAVKDGFTSKRSATSGPHIHAAEPTEVVARGTDGQVVVQWRPPRGCKGVEVWRKVGTPPSRRKDGELVTASDKSATDNGLTNGQRYGYLVLAFYHNAGVEVWSSGVAVKATPVSPPEPVDNLDVTRAGRIVTLRWTPPRNGRVEIRQSKRIPGASKGKIISAVEANRLGEFVESGIGKAKTKPPWAGRVFFVPVTIVGDTGVVGQTVALDQAARRDTRVTYEVVTERNWITRRVTGARIDLRTQGDIRSLNGVVAVLKETTVPMNSSDGVTVVSPTRIKFQNGCATLALALPGRVRAGYVKLFFKDDEAMNGVRLLAPARKRLRVGSGK